MHHGFSVLLFSMSNSVPSFAALRQQARSSMTHTRWTPSFPGRHRACAPFIISFFIRFRLSGKAVYYSCRGFPTSSKTDKHKSTHLLCFFLLYSCGVIPYLFLKALVKYERLLKPQAKAVSEMTAPSSASFFAAVSRR